MLAKLRTSAHARKVALRRDGHYEGGFTLVELLVVMIIVGILAAIAIPVFLNQRKNGYDTTTRSDLANYGLANESYYASNDQYAPNAAALPGFAWSQGTDPAAAKYTFFNTTGGTKATAPAATADGFCVEVKSLRGDKVIFSYDSVDKGIKQATCAARATSIAGIAAGTPAT